MKTKIINRLRSHSHTGTLEDGTQVWDEEFRKISAGAIYPFTRSGKQVFIDGNELLHKGMGVEERITENERFIEELLENLTWDEHKIIIGKILDSSSATITVEEDYIIFNSDKKNPIRINGNVLLGESISVKTAEIGNHRIQPSGTKITVIGGK